MKNSSLLRLLDLLFLDLFRVLDFERDLVLLDLSFLSLFLLRDLDRDLLLFLSRDLDLRSRDRDLLSLDLVLSLDFDRVLDRFL